MLIDDECLFVGARMIDVTGSNLLPFTMIALLPTEKSDKSAFSTTVAESSGTFLHLMTSTEICSTNFTIENLVPPCQHISNRSIVSIFTVVSGTGTNPSSLCFGRLYFQETTRK